MHNRRSHPYRSRLAPRDAVASREARCLRWRWLQWPPALAAVLALLAAIFCAKPATAQINDGVPEAVEGVGVAEKRDAQIPLDLPFTDSTGKKVTLADVFDGSVPVVLTMNYSDCPKLCSVQINALVDAMKKMSWDLGEEYRVLTVSIDPLETPERAQLTRQKYLRDYGRPGSGDGWQFYVSSDNNTILELADTVGFHYRYIPERKEYNHVAVLMICTPDGRVSRYLGGVNYDPNTLRFSLLEASEGKVGSAMDQFLLYCFHYDPAEGRYAPIAFRFVQLGGVLTVLGLGGVLSVYWLRERRKSQESKAGEAAASGAGPSEPKEEGG